MTMIMTSNSLPADHHMEKLRRRIPFKQDEDELDQQRVLDEQGTPLLRNSILILLNRNCRARGSHREAADGKYPCQYAIPIHDSGIAWVVYGSVRIAIL
jgi:hypothetical protein